MNKNYIVEVLTEVVTPMNITAENEKSAIMKALDYKGDIGDQFVLETKVIAIKSASYDKEEE